jgi:hypothetical protein
MDANANQVVTLLLTNGDYVEASMFGTDFASSGLSKYAYTPPHQLGMSDWPTLQELIDDGTRLVTFLGSFPHIGVSLSSQLNNPRL